MKRRWLIAIASLAMVITFVFGVTACKENPNPNNSTKSDEEIAQTAITTLDSLYLKDGAVKNYETPDNYQVLGQVNVDGTLYSVTWTPTAKTEGVNIAECVTIGEKDSKGQVTVGITRKTVDVEYTLTASVTAGQVTKTTEYGHKIPKKSSEEAITATLDLSAAENRTLIDTDNNEQTWKQNGVTLYNYGNVADYVPVRLYKNTTVEISMENAKIIHIDFHSAQGYTDSPYPEYLKTSLENSDLPIKGEITVSEDGLTLGVDFETPQEVVTFKTTAGQCRLTSIDVEAIARDPNEHVHQWTYEHIANTWTHKATCTAAGCDVNTKTEACTPKLNVCECGYTYTAKEIVDALFALEEGGSLPGTYSLTGVVTSVTEVNTTQFYNATFEMTVEGQTVTVYRAKGAHYSEVEVGGTATVTGELLDYGGTKEFTQGSSVVEFTPGVDERTPQQKVDAALQALETTFTVTKTGETALPTSTVNGVTFTWTTTDQTYTITNNKINVTALPAEDATVTATVTAAYGTETVTNNTKQVTITIRAQTEPTPGEGDGTADHPYSVAEATAIIAGLGSETVYKVNGEIALVYVKGIVTVKGTSDSYGIKNYFMADVAGDTENDICLFSLNWGTVKNGTEINVGDTIIVTGYLQNFNGTYEVSSYKDTSWHNGTVEAHTPAGGEVTPPTPDEGTAIYTLSTMTEKGTNSGYAGSGDVTVDGITWSVEGNATMNPWRFGGKNITDQDRKLTSKNAVSGTVTKVVITFGDANITVNKVTFNVYTTDPTADGATLSSTQEVTFSANGTATVTAPAEGWKDCFYQVVFNVTESSSSNKYVTISTMEFYGEGGSTVDPEPTTNYGTLEKPLSVAEALALAEKECAAQDTATKELVYVKGIALSTPENKGTYYGSVEIADAGTETKILVFSVSVRSGVAAPAQNDELVVCGYIKNYYGTIEFATNNNIYVYIEKNTRGESTVTLGEHAGATVTGLTETQTETNGTEVSFTVAPEAGKKIVAVKANGETLKAESENTYKFTVQGNMTVTVETAGEGEAVAELLYSLNSTEQPVGTNNNYAGSCEVTYEGVTWVVGGNAKVDSSGVQKPWRFGGKSITNTDRTLTGKTAVSGTISKITLQLTDSGSITVNSITIKVYKTDPTVDGAELVSTKEVTYQKGVAVDIMADGADWTNCFFQIVFNLTVSGSSNKYVSIDKLEFYGTPAPAAANVNVAPVALLPGKEF